ncbi:MAG: hypothetical protein ACOH1L_01825 [Thermomonas sp.]
MKIIINADRNAAHSGELEQEIERAVKSTASRFATQITRTEVRLTDVNNAKDGVDDKKCVIEVRPAGLNPLAVTHHAPSIELAFAGANTKLGSLLESTFARRDSSRTTPVVAPAD